MRDCIFCKIIAEEIPSQKVWEDDDFIAILDAFPANKGHVLILPKTHVANAYEIDGALAQKAFGLAVKIAGAMKDLDFVEGVNILQNNGEAAGQTVFHFHVHVIPRFKGDSVSVSWKTVSADDTERASLAERISLGLK